MVLFSTLASVVERISVVSRGNQAGTIFRHYDLETEQAKA